MKLTFDQSYGLASRYAQGTRKREIIKSICDYDAKLGVEAALFVEFYVKYKNNKEFPGQGQGFIDVSAWKKAYKATTEFVGEHL